MKIYDCFPFYNELDILELRLATLYDHVDHFVLVEANTTYTSRPKPFYFDENRERYSRWLDKIIHIRVEDMPGNPDAWVNDRFQRDQIYRGIVSAEPNDLILVSDCDEIIRPVAVDYMRNSNQSVFALRMALFNFKFNYMRVTPGEYDVWGMAGRRSLFEELKPDAFRQLRFQFTGAPYQFSNNGCEVIEHGGWHFGYMGDSKWLEDKARSFAHQEINTPEFFAQLDVDASIRERKEWDRTKSNRYEIVELNDYFPNYILSNQDKYAKFIIDNPVANAYNILPSFPYK